VTARAARRTDTLSSSAAVPAVRPPCCASPSPARAHQLVTWMTPSTAGLVVVEDRRIPGTRWSAMMGRWPTIATAHLAPARGPELLSKWRLGPRRRALRGAPRVRLHRGGLAVHPLHAGGPL